MTTSPSLTTIEAARLDPAVFAEVLVGQALWPHQLDVVGSPARYRMICAGRQVGKSRMLAVLALHQAFAQARCLVLLVSAGDAASKRLLEEVASLALSSPLLAGAVVDESRSSLTLSNGSQVLSVPASQRQIRGWAVDLLIVDEAGFIDPEIWRAAEPAIIARPGSRVILCSSPWGLVDHFFRVLWHRGLESPDAMYAGWHWPSSTSPLVDEALLAEIAEREEPGYFRREYLAEWTDDAGAYFTGAELDAAVVDFDLVPPGSADPSAGVVGGVDWGSAHDANTLAVVGVVGVDDKGRKRFRVVWIDERFKMPYADWIEELVASVSVRGGAGYSFGRLVCEANGVGAMPSQVLASRLFHVGSAGVVEIVHTDVRLKENAFGYIRLLLQQGRLELPRDPRLLKQLRALQSEMLPGGGVRIAVPERAGHDDLAMALALAMTAAMGNDLEPLPPVRYVDIDDLFDLDWSPASLY